MDPADELFPIVYDELRRVAARMRAPAGAANPTSLVHEAWLRLAGSQPEPVDELHLRRTVARAMRFVLVDRARQQKSAKRGGDWQRVTLDGLRLPPSDVAELADALERLERADAVAFEVVELRFFGGFSVPETAEALDVSARTVDRAWRRARGFLAACLT